MEIEEFEWMAKEFIESSKERNAICILQQGFPVFIRMATEKMQEFLQELRRGKKVRAYGTVCELSDDFFDDRRMVEKVKQILQGIEGMGKREFLEVLQRLASLFVHSPNSMLTKAIYVAWHEKSRGSDIVVLQFVEDEHGGIIWKGRRRLRGSLLSPLNIWTQVQLEVG